MPTVITGTDGVNQVQTGAVEKEDLFAGFSNGIARAEQWRLTTNKLSAGDITANLARESINGYGGINEGMTESSGVFTFPETGIWVVRFTIVVEEGAGGADRPRFAIKYSPDNMSSTDLAARGFLGLVDPPNEFSSTGTIEYIFDITDTLLQKVFFTVDLLSSGNRVLGSANFRLTGFTFIRLGDT